MNKNESMPRIKYEPRMWQRDGLMPYLRLLFRGMMKLTDVYPYEFFKGKNGSVYQKLMPENHNGFHVLEFKTNFAFNLDTMNDLADESYVYPCELPNEKGFVYGIGGYHHEVFPRKFSVGEPVVPTKYYTDYTERGYTSRVSNPYLQASCPKDGNYFVFFTSPDRFAVEMGTWFAEENLKSVDTISTQLTQSFKCTEK